VYRNMFKRGYPDKFEKNIEIKNIKNFKPNTNEYLFHAGTIKKNEKVYAVSGRVLNFVTLSDDFSDAKKKNLKNLNRLNWPGGFYRKDIGYKVIK